MPAIPKEDRSHARLEPKNVGELTFAICDLIDNYVMDRSRDLDLPPLIANYAIRAEVLGALSCADKEFWRHAGEPYEDVKYEKNGRVFWGGTRPRSVDS